MQPSPGTAGLWENMNGLPPLLPSGAGNFSDSAGPARLYGALIDQQLEARAAASRLCKTRKRINCVAVMLALIVPWSLFIMVFGLVSFYLHYAAPLTTMLCAGGTIALGVSVIASGAQAWAARAEDRFYHLYMGVALTMASVLGCVFGDINFWQYMQPSYHVDHLATYTNVDPSSQHLWSGEDVPVHGKRYQDAGKVYFSHKVTLDLSRAANFKDGNLYCVAPIVNPSCNKNCGFDFWAVGLNCCSELAADFRCGDYNNTRVKSGLRQTADSWRPFFRLAVLQAEGIHKVSSRHPLFFHWVEDPVKELNSWKESGYRRFIIVMTVAFAANAAALLPSLKSARLSS